MRQLPTGFFQLAIVDPPYGLGMAQNAGKSTKYKTKDWDNQAPGPEYFAELKRVSRNQIIWGANHFIDNIPGAKNTPCWVVWDKRENVIPERTFADAELAHTTFDGPTRVFRHYWDGFLQKVKEQRNHPTQKPVALYEWCLDRFAIPGAGPILDTHLGSASFVLACLNMGFDFMGFEIDAEYFKAAQKRIAEFKAQPRLVFDKPEIVQTSIFDNPNV